MKYYFSADSGGTKTAFLLTDESGRAVGRYITSGCTYSVMGSERVYEILKNGADGLLKSCGAVPEEIGYAVWGLSCFGEYEELDRFLANALPKLFPCGSYLCNDVETGLAGSLALESGIHIVAGTGAIIMAKNRNGEKARSNGWHEAFSDEGSAYWLGMRALGLFAKQADGREKRSCLYQLFHEYLKIERDMDILLFYRDHLEGKRDKVAALQKILLEAAVKGDRSAEKLYREAAWELALSVLGVAGKLGMMGEDYPVSCYGGVFKAGAFILEPLTEYLSRHGFTLIEPRLSPLSGGILLAAQSCGGPVEAVGDQLKQDEKRQEEG